MNNTLPNHFRRDFFCSEEYHRNFLDALRKTAKKFIEENKSKNTHKRVVAGLEQIYADRRHELLEYECKGIITMQQNAQMLVDLNHLLRELEEI